MDKCILICDDDTDILSICTYILEERNWEVHTKTNCVDITEVVRSIKPSVILMDNWLPDTGGILATKSIKADPELSEMQTPKLLMGCCCQARNLL